MVVAAKKERFYINTRIFEKYIFQIFFFLETTLSILSEDEACLQISVVTGRIDDSNIDHFKLQECKL